MNQRKTADRPDTVEPADRLEVAALLSGSLAVAPGSWRHTYTEHWILLWSMVALWLRAGCESIRMPPSATAFSSPHRGTLLHETCGSIVLLYRRKVRRIRIAGSSPAARRVDDDPGSESFGRPTTTRFLMQPRGHNDVFFLCPSSATPVINTLVLQIPDARASVLAGAMDAPSESDMNLIH